MGYIGEIGHPDVQAAIERAAAMAADAGKPIGIVGPNPEMVKRFQQYGYSFTAIGSDIAMMTGRARDWLAQLRSAPAEQSAATAAY
jgi:2-dehydro-3-deoxyglucarate aldolase/4-hydroxy-2-oxoheptanedioate aldolase